MQSTFLTLVVPACTQWVRKVNIDDWISFKVSGGLDVLCVRVLKVTRFMTFEAMLQQYGTSDVLPGMEARPGADGIDEAVSLYHSMANREGTSYKELERQHGVVAIEVQVLFDGA